MRLCGISSRFQLLSPCVRQVTHALLTRPPLSHKIIIPEENQIKCFVRLACVKHAASVHPEPGSNSLKKVFPNQNLFWLTVLRSHLLMLSCKKFCQFLLTFPPYQAKTLRIFQGCFTVQLSRLFVLLSQATTPISYHSHSLLSTTFLFF